MGFKRKDILTSALASGYTYTRTGVGTRYNSSGTETDITANNGRFNHNRTTPFTARGLMFEAARTNNFQRSLALDNAYWNATTNVSPTATTGGYDGASTAFTFTDANGVSMGNGFAKTSGLGIALTSPCISMRMKYVSRRYYEFAAVFASGTRRYHFDLQTGTSLNNGGAAWTGGGMVDEGDGWYRCWAYLSGAQTLNQIFIVPRGALDAVTITGNGSVALAQRPQLEEGTLPSSTINTTTAALTRGLDVCQISTPPVNTSQPFAMLIKYSLLPGASAGGPLVYEATDGSSINSDSGETCKVLRFDGSSALDYTEDDAVVSLLNYTPGSVNIYLGSNSTSTALNGCISEVQWWEGAMSDALMLSSADSGNFPASISNSRFGTGSLGLGRVGLGQIGIKH